MGGKALDKLRPSLKQTFLKPSMVSALQLLMAFDKEGTGGAWGKDGLFHDDPKRIPGYVEAIRPSKPVWLAHLVKAVTAERAIDVNAKVEEMFGIASRYNASHPKVMAHVEDCQKHWREELAPLITQAETTYATLPTAPSGDECQLCKCGDLYLPERGPYQCAVCHTAIVSKASKASKATPCCTLFLSDTHYAVMCSKCPLGEVKTEGGEWEVDGVTFQANQVHILPTSELCGATKEEMISCDGCAAWEHVVCTAALGPCLMDPNKHHLCASCLGSKPEYAALRQFTAVDDVYHPSNSPGAKTGRAVWINGRLQAFLVSKQVAADYVVVEASRTDKILDVGAPLRAFLQALGARNTEDTIEYRHTFLLLFHTGGGALDCSLVAGLTLQEYITGPAETVVYLAYLDSLNHVQPQSRAPAIQGFGAATLASAAVLGSTKLKILSVTPGKGRFYLLCERPDDMLLDPPKVQQPKLVSWCVLLHLNTSTRDTYA
jgi:hypothetical protein